MKAIKIVTAMLLCFSMTILISCSKDPVEKALDQLAIVAKWEKKEKEQRLTYEDAEQFNRELSKVENQELLVNNEKLTAQQNERILQLSLRAKHLTRRYF